MKPHSNYPHSITQLDRFDPRVPWNPSKPIKFLLLIDDLASARDLQQIVNKAVKMPRYAELAAAGKVVAKYAPQIEITEEARQEVMVNNFHDEGIDDPDMRRRRRTVRTVCMVGDWGVPTPVGVQEVRDVIAAEIVRLQTAVSNPDHVPDTSEILSEPATLAIAEIMDAYYKENPKASGAFWWSGRLREVRDRVIDRWTRWAAQLQRAAAHKSSTTRPVSGGGMRNERASSPAYAPVYAPPAYAS